MESRIEAIEVKVSFAEYLLDELNDTVVRHQRHVDTGLPAEQGSPRDETAPN